MNIPLYRPFVCENVLSDIEKVFSTKWLGYGKNAIELENKFISKWGGFSVATNSCTSALYIVARTIKQSEKDEVIIPAITFVSTGMAFYNAGYKVVVADVDENGLLNFDSVLRLINKNTRAIVPVHLYGQKCDLSRLRKLCDSSGVLLVEDCAHRIGYNDEERQGDFACFSFNTMKELPSGEGGIAWGKHKNMEAALRSIANVGLGENTLQRTSSVKHGDYVFGNTSGLKFLQSDIIAAVTCAQWKYYERNIVKRKQLFDVYDETLSQKKYARVLQRNADDSYLMYVVRIRREFVERFRTRLADNGIATSHHYPNLARHPLFVAEHSCDIADNMQHELVTLPCFIDMCPEELQFIVRTIQEIE